MEAHIGKELNYIVQDLRNAVSVIERAAEGIERDCRGIESARCTRYLMYLTNNYQEAINRISKLQ